MMGFLGSKGLWNNQSFKIVVDKCPNFKRGQFVETLIYFCRKIPMPKLRNSSVQQLWCRPRQRCGPHSWVAHGWGGAEATRKYANTIHSIFISSPLLFKSVLLTRLYGHWLTFNLVCVLLMSIYFSHACSCSCSCRWRGKSNIYAKYSEHCRKHESRSSQARTSKQRIDGHKSR